MPFSELKHFVLRRIAAEVARAESGPSVPRGPKAQIIAQLSKAFVALATDDAKLVTHLPLHELLGQQLTVVSTQPIPPSKAHRAARDSFIASLTEQIQDNQCGQCGPCESHICNGSASLDKQKLESIGHCVRSIKNQFDFLRKVVRSLIASHAFSGDMSSAADVDVRLAWNFSVAGVLAAGAVVGRTQFHDAANLRLSEVTLELEPAMFDWESLVSVPWLLAHEMICHAYQGRLGAKREMCDPQCMFYEGWMDELAFRMLDALLRSVITINYDIDEPVPKAFLDHAREILDEARRQRAGGVEAPPPVILGRRVANLTLEFFRAADQRTDRSQVEASALGQLIGLSYRIQDCNPSPAEAELAIIRILSALKSLPRASYAQQVTLRDLLGNPIPNFSVWLQDLAATALN